MYCGEVDAATALAEAADAGAWLNLLPDPSAAAFPRAALEAGKLSLAHVPVAPPHALTLALAARVVAAAEEALGEAGKARAAAAGAGAGGLVVQCASGNRA